jgi:hypothetical protein
VKSSGHGTEGQQVHLIPLPAGWVLDLRGFENLRNVGEGIVADEWDEAFAADVSEADVVMILRRAGGS